MKENTPEMGKRTIIELGDGQRVEVDESFLRLSPEEQNATVQEIASSLGSHTAPHAASRTYDVQGPDGQTYEVTAPASATEDEVLSYAQREVASGRLKPASASNARLGSPTANQLASIIEREFPGSRITSTARSPRHNAEVGGSPTSYHFGGHAVDFVKPPGVDLKAIKARLQALGIMPAEALDEGDHIHLAVRSLPQTLAADDGQGVNVGRLSAPPEASPASPSPSAVAKVAPVKLKGSTADGTGAFLYGLGDTATWGFLDEAGAVVDSIIPGQGRPTVWDGKGFTDAWSKNVDLNRQILRGSEQAHPRATLAGQLVGGFATPIPGTGARGVVNLARKAELLNAVKAGAISGAAYGAGSTEGNLVDRGLGAAVGGATGAVGGGLVGGAAIGVRNVGSRLLRKVAPQVAQRVFERGQAGNAYVGHDAQVAQDLRSLVGSVTAKASASRKVQNATIAGRVDQLADSYLPRHLLRVADISSVDKQRMSEAMDNALILAPEDIQALRGTSVGDLVADGIERVQRLRSYVPEGSSSGSRGSSVGGILADTAASALGSHIGGPAGAAVGSAARRGVGDMLRSSPEATTATLAKRLADKADAFAKLAEKSGLPVSTGGRKAAWEAAQKAANAKRLAEEADAKGKALDAFRKQRERETRPTSHDLASFRVDIGNPDLHPLDVALNRAAKVSKDAASTLDRAKGKMFDLEVKANDITPDNMDALRQRIGDKAIDPNDLVIPQTDAALVSKAKSRADALDKLGLAQRQWDRALDDNLGLGTRRTFAYGPNGAPVKAPPPDRSVSIRNDLDNVKPGGGYRGYLYDRTGLLPKEQDIGALQLLQGGKITPDHFDSFLKSPDDLQAGNAGNAILDRLAAMAEDGTLPRDPKWSPPQVAPQAPGVGAGVPLDASGQPIRNPFAYQATAKGNQDRVSGTLNVLHANEGIPDSVRQTLGEAIARLGSTSNAADADAIVSQARQAVPDELKDYAARLLSPLAQQIK